MRKLYFDKKVLAGTLGVLIFVCVLLTSEAAEQSNGEYELRSGAVGAGGVSSEGDYSMYGVFGQPAAGQASGGDYTVIGGVTPRDGFYVRLVTFKDFARVATQWLMVGQSLEGDLDGSGDVGMPDLYLIADYWLRPYPVDWPPK